MYDDIIEKFILSCLLQSEHCIKTLRIKPKHFLKRQNAELLELFIYSFQKNQVLDMTIIATEVPESEASNIIGCCLELLDLLPSISNFEFYQDKQIEEYKGKQIERIVLDYRSKSYTYDEMIEAFKKVENEFAKSIQNDMSEEDIYQLITSDSNILQFYQFKNLERWFQIPENTVNVIAARTSVGKSGFALNLLNDLSKNYKCVYFNMEMTEKQLWQRLAGMNSDVEINSLHDLQGNEESRIRHAIREVKSRNIKIINGSKSTKALRSIITRESREEHTIFFIDYIGFVTNGKSNQGDTERIGEALREIQSMVMDYNATAFVLAQINRSGNEQPSLVHLKDSGELEQTAHCCMVLHNPDKDVTVQTPILDLLILKNRSGRLGKMNVEYNKKTQRIREVTNVRR